MLEVASFTTKICELSDQTPGQLSDFEAKMQGKLDYLIQGNRALEEQILQMNDEMRKQMKPLGIELNDFKDQLQILP
jgi:cysteinyl-tRNA synthetase